MIAHLHGTVFRKTTESIIIHVGGIGYEVFVPLSTFYQLPDESETTSLHIYTHVREDMLALFGFYSRLERSIFLMLISVSGIGPKLAINILSGIGPQELLAAIACGDSVRLQSIPGVGKKTAERISLELKDRAIKTMGQVDLSLPKKTKEKAPDLVDDAVSALTNLGYSIKTAKPAIERAVCQVDEVTMEKLIREALRILA